MELFEIKDSDYIELNNLLKVIGLCESGGIAKMLIADGQVMVDGHVELLFPFLPAKREIYLIT